MMDAVSEKRLAAVNPTLANKIRQLAQILAGEGIEIRVTQGLRTIAEQDALYAQGRTKPGAIVTNCPGGRSWHNYGLAADLVPDDLSKSGFQCDWNPAHPAWKRMVEVGVSLGLTSGSTWRTFPDFPHFQYTGRFPENAPDNEVRELAKSGLQEVWDSMNFNGDFDGSLSGMDG